jgi:hypothetical protein
MTSALSTHRRAGGGADGGLLKTPQALGSSLGERTQRLGENDCSVVEATARWR